MTKKEALIAMLPTDFNVSDNLIEKVFLEQEITGAETYSPSSKKSLDMAYKELLQFALTEPELSEGGLTIKLSKSAIRKEIKRINKQYGISDGIINSKTNRW